MTIYEIIVRTTKRIFEDIQWRKDLYNHKKLWDELILVYYGSIVNIYLKHSYKRGGYSPFSLK